MDSLISTRIATAYVADLIFPQTIEKFIES